VTDLCWEPGKNGRRGGGGGATNGAITLKHLSHASKFGIILVYKSENFYSVEWAELHRKRNIAIKIFKISEKRLTYNSLHILLCILICKLYRIRKDVITILLTGLSVILSLFNILILQWQYSYRCSASFKNFVIRYSIFGTVTLLRFALRPPVPPKWYGSFGLWLSRMRIFQEKRETCNICYNVIICYTML
jgi:hypothetical protein